MINGIGNGAFAGAQYYSSVTNKSGGSTALAENKARNDVVSISDSYRASTSSVSVAVPEPVQTMITEADMIQSSLGSGALGKYANVGLGTGETNLTAMNFSRKKIGSKVDDILKSAGIKLGKDERVAMSIGADNRIKVSGIKDKKKAAQIEEALNEDKTLGKEMRTHAATGRITQNAKKQQDYEDWLNQNGQAIPDDIDELFTHSGIRAFILDEYLQEQVGVGVGDLSLVTDENGNETFANMSDPLTALFSEDPSLENTLKRMVREGKTDTTFSASFEFANGAISDPASLDMAKSKLEDIKARVMGGFDKATGDEMLGEVDKVLGTMDEVGVSIDDEELRTALERGFTIRFDNTGKFEVVSEDMSADTKLFLERIVQKAMDDWARAGEGNEKYVLEGLGGDRIANLADVADAFIEEHRFEHGDVDEHKHQVEFHFGGSVNNAKVVSDEADRAQDEKNKELSAELGGALREMLGENGIDASNMTMEIDQNGKITVLGDPKDPELQKAQTLIDSFVKDAKNTGPAESGVTSSRENLPANERRTMLFGDEEEEYTPEGWAKRDVVVDSDTPEKVEETEEEARLRSYGLSQETRATIAAENWKKVMPGLNPEETIHNGVVSGRVSNIKTPLYSADEITSAIGNPNLAGRDKAVSLYRELMNGMQFHDGRRDVRYAM